MNKNIKALINYIKRTKKNKKFDQYTLNNIATIYDNTGNITIIKTYITGLKTKNKSTLLKIIRYIGNNKYMYPKDFVAYLLQTLNAQ